MCKKSWAKIPRCFLPPQYSAPPSAQLSVAESVSVLQMKQLLGILPFDTEALTLPKMNIIIHNITVQTLGEVIVERKVVSIELVGSNISSL